jgi:thiol:disulfide interchange protein DsbC
MFKRILTTTLLAHTAVPALAAAPDAGIEQKINNHLQVINPALKVERVGETPLPGLYEVLIDGQIFYFSADGRYMVQGDLVDLKNRKSLTEPRRQEVRLEALKKVQQKNMLIYPAKGERKQVVTVFTDIDCAYCRRLHQHMPEMNERGIEVRYLLMPRAGVQSESYRKAVNVWCADKPREAMTVAKQGRAIENKQCENPVQAHMALAEQLGVNATPTLITDRGGLHPGYLPPDQLLARLQAEDDEAAE